LLSAGALPQTPLWELAAFARPDLLAVFKGPTSRGRKGKEGKGEGKEEEVVKRFGPPKNFGVAPSMAGADSSRKLMMGLLNGEESVILSGLV